MSDTVSVDSIWAQMPHNVLTRVLGGPTHKQIKMGIRELTANLMAVSCPWGHGKGHLGLLQDPTIYAACNSEVFTIPADEPPAYPVMPNGATEPQREELRANNCWRSLLSILVLILTLVSAGRPGRDVKSV